MTQHVFAYHCLTSKGSEANKEMHFTKKNTPQNLVSSSCILIDSKWRIKPSTTHKYHFSLILLSNNKSVLSFFDNLHSWLRSTVIELMFNSLKVPMIRLKLLVTFAVLVGSLAILAHGATIDSRYQHHRFFKKLSKSGML